MLWRLFLLGGALAAALAAGNNWLLRHQRDALTAEVARVTAESAQYRAAAHVCREALREQAKRIQEYHVEAEEAQRRADAAARQALTRRLPPKEGTGPESMNRWLGAL